MHEIPNRFTQQFCFGTTQHVAKCLIDEDQSSLCILAKDASCCLPEDGAETFLGFTKRFFCIQAFGDVESSTANQDCITIRSWNGELADE